ncbi:MAG: hypothetical protein LBD84_05665 [Campylobacteraceae bacterium]|nr:hypothetical protein [Campylobacteraceae bacterium]
MKAACFQTELMNLKMIELPLKLGFKVALSYKPLKILLALKRNPRYYLKEYFALIEMLKTYDNLYADISGVKVKV